MINISPAMSDTSSCLFPSSIFLLLLLLSGGAKKEAEIPRTPAPATDSKVDAARGWTAAPLHRSHPVTAAPLHPSLHVTAAPRHLGPPVTAAPLRRTRPTTAGPLPLGRPATDAPRRPKMELRRRHTSRGALRSPAACQSHLQRAVRKRNRKKEVRTISR